MANEKMKIVHPKKPKSGETQVSLNFLAYGQIDNYKGGIRVYLVPKGTAQRIAGLQVVGTKKITPAIGTPFYKWWAYFSDLQEGQIYSLVAANANQTGKPDICVIKSTSLVSSRKVRGVITTNGVISPGANESFCPTNFYAYGLLEAGDNYITDASMTPAGGISIPADFLHSDPDTGYWVAEFDNIAAADLTVFNFQATGDTTGPGNTSYAVVNLIVASGDC